jgi:hypothetical protein
MSSLLLLAFNGLALADSPPEAPRLITLCSASGKFCASSDPKTHLTVVKAKSSEKVLWSIKGWHPSLAISNDGQSLVVGYSGGNLVPIDVTLKEPMLTFYQHEKIIRVVRLGDLYRSKSELTPTVSHLAWGTMSSIDQNNRIRVFLINGKQVTFDVKTGLSVNNK